MTDLHTTQAALLGQLVATATALANAGQNDIDGARLAVEEAERRIGYAEEGAERSALATKTQLKEVREDLRIERDRVEGEREKVRNLERLVADGDETIATLGGQVERYALGIHPDLRTARGRVVAHGREFFAVRFGRDVIRATRSIQELLEAAGSVERSGLSTPVAHCGTSVAKTFEADPSETFSIVPSKTAAGFRMEF